MMQKLSQKDWEQMATGGTQFSQGDFEGALATFSSVRSRATDPRELSAILFNEAQCYRLLRRFKDAHAACDRALELSKGDDESTVSGWIVKTDILVDERRFSDALSVIESSLRCYPNLERNQQLLRRAELLANQHQYAEAIPVLNCLLETADFEEAEIATIHHTLGVSYGALGKFDDAAHHLLKAQLPQLPKGYVASNSFWLATIAAKRLDFPTAKSHLLKALAQARYSNVDVLGDVYESLANVSRELGDDTDATMYANLWKASNRSTN
jgi:tetratricopeptide (TPR) repeat protein